MSAHLWHKTVIGLKSAIYGRRGEPYHIEGQTLRYLPGTRPIRLRYRTSRHAVARYDALQIAWLTTHLKEGDTAIDIGAHHGVMSVLMAAKCGQSGRVIAFEPDPHARAVLMKNLSLNPKVKRPDLEGLACSDEVGEATLFSRGGNSQSSLARTGLGSSGPAGAERIQVSVVTLDSYLSQRGLPTPSCVKIDAEGAEIRILKGARQVLLSEADILCELHPYAWPEFQNTLHELKDLVASTGRRIRYLDQNAEIGDDALYGTVLLERKS
jgi:FkbM family methyltransferase